MRILLDECIDWRLGRELPGHQVESVQQRGWSGIKNGRLLALAAEHYDVFITADRNLSFQQFGPDLPLLVVVLAAGSVKRRDLVPLIPKVSAALAGRSRGRLLIIRP
ncbi:MAG: DUF5615 family PIN-like protein [Opitutae bacterium]|nr:DUF5615 family PIN-like protein [Opitutae bacterium]